MEIWGRGLSAASASPAMAAPPGFMRRFADVDGVGALALSFAILVAARSGKLRVATWSEIEFDNACRSIPAECMRII